jgi:hypothetical protein
MELIAQIKLLMLPNSRGTITNRKLIGNSRKHNWSCRTPANMIIIFLESS